MSFFVQSAPARAPKTKNIRGISIALAGIITLMAVAQLFKFEEFPRVIEETWLPVGGDMSLLWAAFIVILEVLALPFLLAMYLSKAMRITSMVAGWLIAVVWLKITIWENISGSITANSGLLGATLPLPVGWWNVLLCLALGILVAWASWGMWPFARRTKALS